MKIRGLSFLIVGFIIAFGIYSIYTYVKTGVVKEGLTFCDDLGCYWAPGDIHAVLDIIVCGEEIKLPVNLGGKEEVHTHTERNTLHFEYKLPIDPQSKEVLDRTPLRLKTFLDLAEIEFNESCVIGSCNGDLCKGKLGRLTMTVNGIENTKFQNYEWEKDDRIIVKFE